MSTVLSARFEEFGDYVESVMFSGDRRLAGDAAKETRSLLRRIEEMQSRCAGYSAGPSLDLSYGARQKRLALSLLEPLEAILDARPKGAVLDVLDADCGFGHSAEFFGALYATSALGRRIRMVACTSSPKAALYAQSMARNVALTGKALADLERRYDVVLSVFHLQRTIEPAAVCAHMQSLARDRVLVVAPYAEEPGALAKGHLSVVDDGMLERIGAEEALITRNPGWGGQIVRFALPGAAAPEANT